MSKIRIGICFIVAVFSAFLVGLVTNPIDLEQPNKTTHSDETTESIVVIKYVPDIQHLQDDDISRQPEYYDTINIDLTELYIQYPDTTKIWEFLTQELELNNYIVAGIIGNIMYECGGNTLTIHPEWNCFNNPGMKNKTVDEQLNQFKNEIKSVFDADGNLYRNEFAYEDFCEISDCAEAAEAFMLIYMKMDKQSIDTIKMNALNAYATYVK